MNVWAEAQEIERTWWGDCVNTFQEESKQLTYAEKMGLVSVAGAGQWPLYDLAGKRVVDIGGGPVSMLLKSINFGGALVVDPCEYPEWVWDRYHEHGIATVCMPAEEYDCIEQWDEAWIYNVLQHVQEPAKVIEVARKCAKTIRIFEWINIQPYPGHPHMLTQGDLDFWLSARHFTPGPGSSVIEWLESFGGVAYYGVFPTASGG